MSEQKRFLVAISSYIAHLSHQHGIVAGTTEVRNRLKITESMLDLVRKTVFEPDVDQVARALARKFRWNIQATGMAALNLLGLSTQIQGRYAYMTDGPSRKYNIDGRELTFVHTAFKNSGFSLRESALLVEGLKTLGTQRITEETIDKLRSAIPIELRPRILKDTRTAVAWIRDVILRVCRKGA